MDRIEGVNINGKKILEINDGEVILKDKSRKKELSEEDKKNIKIED